MSLSPSRSGYFPSPWPGEDAGPERLQEPHGVAGLALKPGERLRCTTRRTMMSTMTVLGTPGEVFLLTHSAVRANVGLPTTSCVELLDPRTLQARKRSPRLAGGPMWPGGMAVHRNGDLYVVFGRYAHRLSRDCEPLAQLQLGVAEPHNSFVILDSGLLVTKNLSDRTPAQLVVIDPETMQPVGAPVVCPEPSIARLSSSGDTVYVVGVRSIFRYHLDAGSQRLQLDEGWRFEYLGGAGQTYGWDVVIDGRDAWFLDNGKHRYVVSMIGAGVSRTANRLIRVSLSDSSDAEVVEVCGVPGGSVTNPPLFDRRRRIAVGYDSANRCLQAWQQEGPSAPLRPLWHKAPFGCASHMILYPDTGELVVNDYRRLGEEVTVLDVETGHEKARVRIGGIMQGVVFPSVGWGRDFYWSSMGKVARVWVDGAS